MLANSVSPPTGGTSRASSIEPIGGAFEIGRVGMPDAAEIGPLVLQLDDRRDLGEASRPLRNGYSIGSPNRCAKADELGRRQVWSRKKTTRWSSQARRIAATMGSSRSRRSTPVELRTDRPSDRTHLERIAAGDQRPATLRNAALMRDCQPGPPARKWATTSGSSRMFTASFGSVFFRRPPGRAARLPRSLREVQLARTNPGRDRSHQFPRDRSICSSPRIFFVGCPCHVEIIRRPSSRGVHAIDPKPPVQSACRNLAEPPRNLRSSSSVKTPPSKTSLCIGKIQIAFSQSGLTLCLVPGVHRLM